MTRAAKGGAAKERPGGLRAVWALFSLLAHDPELAAAQLEMLSGEMPLMYVILLSNALALACTHYNCAPKALTIGLPAALCLMAAWRSALWLLWRHRSPDNAAVMARLRRVVLNTAMLGSFFTAWALALFPYGGPYLQCHVEFFIAITVICCNSCLT